MLEDEFEGKLHKVHLSSDGKNFHSVSKINLWTSCFLLGFWLINILLITEHITLDLIKNQYKLLSIMCGIALVFFYFKTESSYRVSKELYLIKRFVTEIKE